MLAMAAKRHVLDPFRSFLYRRIKMAEQKNPQETPNRAAELDDQQLDQVAGGTTRGTTDLVGAPKVAYEDKMGDPVKGVAQVGLDVASN